MTLRILPFMAFLSVAAMATSPARAQPVDPTVFSLAAMTNTARASALGGASAALPARAVASFLENPAHLAPSFHNQVSVSLLNHVSSLRTGTLAGARDYGHLGSFGVALRFLSWGEIDRADAAGNTDGSFSAGEFALSIASSRPLTARVRGGVSLEWLRSSIDGQSASALAVSAGLMRYSEERQLGLSASVHALGAVLSSIGQTGDSLPLDVRLGLSKRLQYLPLLISVTAYDLTDFDDPTGEASAVTRVFHHLRLGGEFQFSDSFQVRFGYDRRRHDALKIKSRLDFAGFSFGTGLAVGRVAIDYAFNSWSSLGGLHQFTVETSF